MSLKIEGKKERRRTKNDVTEGRKGNLVCIVGIFVSFFLWVVKMWYDRSDMIDV